MTNTTSSSVSPSNTAMDTTFTTYFTFNHINKTIVGSEFNFKMSGNPKKPQYEALMKAMACQPAYTLSPIASTKKVEKKQTYKGLNFELMMDYVEFKGNKVQKAEFQAIVDDNASYPTIKSWFLDNFKYGFTVEKAKREIAEHKLGERKAKVRATVRVKTTETAPAVVAMPTAQNF